MDTTAKCITPTYTKVVIDKYTKYAIDNKVFRDGVIPNNAKALISACNNHRQNYLLYDQNGGLGHSAETKCWKLGYGYNDDCDGVYTNGYTYCDCGNKWVWYSEHFDPSDVDLFNIESTEPFGYINPY
jgi:hypothetical protein